NDRRKVACSRGWRHRPRNRCESRARLAWHPWASGRWRPPPPRHLRGCRRSRQSDRPVGNRRARKRSPLRRRHQRRLTRCFKLTPGRVLMKFLVIWHLQTAGLTPEVVKAVMEQPKYGKKLEADGKLECRYHIVGSHGGAWIYKVKSNEELDLLL